MASHEKTRGKHGAKMSKKEAGRGIYTETELESWRIDTKGTELRERDGLRGKARQGRKGISIRWAYQYYSPTHKRQREIACGIWPKGKMKAIRAARDAAALQVVNGIDPLDYRDAEMLKESRRLAEEREAAAARQAAERAESDEHRTVDDLVNEWLSSHSGPAQANGNAVLRARYEKHAAPVVGQIEVRHLTEEHLADMLGRIVAAGHNRTAEMVASDFRSCFRWGEQRSPWRRLLVEGNPAEQVLIDRILDENYQDYRDRVLQDKEIVTLYKTFIGIRQDYADAPAGTKYSMSRPIPEQYECAAWIMLGTLCRVGELSKAKWENVDLKKRTWFIPRGDVKKVRGNKHKAILIHLSGFAMAAFRRLHRLTGHTPFLFPSDQRGEKSIGHVNDKAITRGFTDRQVKFSKSKGKMRRQQDNSLVIGSERWTSHDLRRTGATIMQGLHVDLAVIDQCQNHALSSSLERDQDKRVAGGGVRRHYLHYQYTPEMRAAWNSLGDYLDHLIRSAIA